MKLGNHFIQLIFSLVLTLCLTAACDRSDQPLAVSSNCRVVQHIAGESCIPQEPKRVVTLDGVSLEYALALGIQPIGSVLDQLDEYLIERISGIENIGSAGAPNLEKILWLKPDLILGLDFHQTIYSEITKIAPAVLFEFEYSGRWKELFQTFSATLGKSQIAQQVLDRYYQRIDQFKQNQFKQNQFKRNNDHTSFNISIIRIDPISIYPYFQDSFCGVILQDVGLSRPPAQQLSAAEAQRKFGNPIQAAISKEQLEFVDGDVIFVWIGENTIEATQHAKAQLEKLKVDPLWQKLTAVQQNRVYHVSSDWIGSGPIAANRVIDDLFKYLVNP